jgi:hypothetical protein
MEANTNDDRNESTACQDVMEDSPEKMERQRVHEEETEIHSLKDDQNETTACNEQTEKIDQNTGMMQSTEEHQDIVSEDVEVKPRNSLVKYILYCDTLVLCTLMHTDRK